MRPLSFVVLPLHNASGDRRQDYVADSITEYLTADLSRIRDSFAIARASAASFTATTVDVTKAGQEFGVHYVLRGTTTEQDGKIRVAVELVDAETSQNLWSEVFTREIADLAALRSEVIARIAQSVDAGVAESHQPEARATRPEPELVDLLLQSKALLQKPQTAETTTAARRLLEAALQRDPCSSEAMTGLASVHLAEALSGWSPAPGQDLGRAAQLLDSALAADPGDARAQALRGVLLRVQGKPAVALAAYRAAVAADPNFAEAHAEIGRLMIDFGQAAEALAPIEQALRLSPLDPQRSLWFSFAGMALLYADKAAEAVPWLEKSAELNPRFLNAQIWLAAAYQLAGQAAKAASALQAALRLSPNLTIARLERQLAADDPRVRQQRSRVFDGLKRAGLPD